MVSSEINIKQKMADTIRFLASDMGAKSKTPGTPRGLQMGLCPILWVGFGGWNHS